MTKSVLFVTTLLTLSAVSCGGKGDLSPERQTTLFALGDSTIRLQDVLDRIPQGLDPADSLRMFDGIIDEMVADYLLEEYALQNLDNADEINRRTADFRRRLIIEQYRRLMSAKSENSISSESIKTYYQTHSDSLLLERPVVRGIYVKLPSDAPEAEDVRKWVARASGKSIANLEKYGLSNALHYENFNDKWVDWRVIANLIPYRFGQPDDFVAHTSMFEIEQSGAIYLLHITDHMASGEKMPYEFAVPLIKRILTANASKQTDDELIHSMLNSAIDDRKIIAESYDPVTHSPVKKN